MMGVGGVTLQENKIALIFLIPVFTFLFPPSWPLHFIFGRIITFLKSIEGWAALLFLKAVLQSTNKIRCICYPYRSLYSRHDLIWSRGFHVPVIAHAPIFIFILREGQTWFKLPPVLVGSFWQHWWERQICTSFPSANVNVILSFHPFVALMRRK